MTNFAIDFSDPNDTAMPDNSTFVSAIPDPSGDGTFIITIQPPVDPQNDTVPPIVISGCIGGHPHRPA